MHGRGEEKKCLINLFAYQIIPPFPTCMDLHHVLQGHIIQHIDVKKKQERRELLYAAHGEELFHGINGGISDHKSTEAGHHGSNESMLSYRLYNN
jgi:hypothetical protein